MSSSVNEHQEQRENTSMEDSRAMTIKFLRARLLSERSVSKTAMQRAEELSKRVMELEEQLNVMSIQRKKAEKATAGVLAILEKHGISDMSEGFDSNSDQDRTRNEFKTNSLMLRETSTKNKARKNEMEAYYSSEIESSPSTGRSLTWKSTKDSQYSLEKKKYTDSTRGRTSFALNCSSARRAVKSCRRIRRRDTRAVEEFKNDGPVEASFPRAVSDCFDGEPDALRDINNLDSGKKPVDNPMLESDSGSQKINGRFVTIQERDKDMESALQHQAQLIGRYEEEEKAQREWEEKFRENNSCEQDSGDLGNRSDVTEEQGDINLPAVSDATRTLCSNNQGMEGKSLGTRFSEDPAPNSLPSFPNAKKGFLQDSSKSPDPEISVLVSNGNNDPEIPRSHYDTSVHVSSNMAYPSSKVSSHAEESMPLFVSPSSSSSLSLTVVRQEASTNLGSVLEELHQAKSSLQEKLNSSSLVDRGTSNTRGTFKIPTSYALLQLPTEDQYKTKTMANHPDVGVPSSFSRITDEVSGSKFFTRPYVNPRMSLSNDMFYTVPSSTYTETRFRVPPQRALSQPRLGTVPPSYNQTIHMDPYTNMVLPYVKDSYPFLPDFTLRLP